MKAYKVGFTYLDEGFAIIPEADDEDMARAMAVALLAELRNPVITSLEEYDSPQEAVESFQEAQENKEKKYVN